MSKPERARGGKKRRAVTRRHPLPKRKAAADLVPELASFTAVANALEPLAPDRRLRVVKTVCEFLSIDLAA